MGGGRAKSVVPVAGMLLPWLVVKLPGKEFLLGLPVRSLTLLSDDCPRYRPGQEGCLPPRCPALGVGPAGSCSLARRLWEQYEVSGVWKERSRVVWSSD